MMDNVIFDETIQRIDECISEIKMIKYDNLVSYECVLPCQTVEKDWRTQESSGQR